MTTFLWLIEKKKLSIISYQSKTFGKAHLKNKEFVFTEVTVKPIITIDSVIIRDDIYNLIVEASSV